MTAPPFELTERRIDAESGTFSFAYRSGEDTFTETFVLADPTLIINDPNHPTISHLLDIAHLCVGVSYYKLWLSETVKAHRVLHPDVIALTPHLYDAGLRELAVRNGLDVPLNVQFHGPDRSPDAVPEPFAALSFTPKLGPLVPFGGGKDSTLTLSLLDHPIALTIHPTTVQRRSAAAAKVPLIEVERHLDPLLFERTAQGGFNGHVPITAINSAIASLIGALMGHRDIILANERSAEEPTQFVGSTPINHQYSKTFAFERAFATALAPTAMRYFSAVRRYSEIAIARALAHDRTLRNAIISCNRVFSLTNPPDNPKWCRNCAKCRFTFVAFALFLEPEEAIEMFGGNLLDDPEQISGVRELWTAKPFDCVGELAESAIALAALGTHAAWKETRVVTALHPEATQVAHASGSSLASLLEPTGDDLVPDEYRRRIEAGMARAELSS